MKYLHSEHCAGHIRTCRVLLVTVKLDPLATARQHFANGKLKLVGGDGQEGGTYSRERN